MLTAVKMMFCDLYVCKSKIYGKSDIKYEGRLTFHVQCNIKSKYTDCKAVQCMGQHQKEIPNGPSLKSNCRNFQKQMNTNDDSTKSTETKERRHQQKTSKSKSKYIKNSSLKGKCHADYKIKTTYCLHIHTSNIKIQMS